VHVVVQGNQKRLIIPTSGARGKKCGAYTEFARFDLSRKLGSGFKALPVFGKYSFERNDVATIQSNVLLTNADSARRIRSSSDLYVRAGFTERLDSLGVFWWAVGDSNSRPAD
jgi:hypothetical protein